MTKLYTGVGARDAPADVCAMAEELGYHLGLAGWTLRSGAADGMDKAFETGARRAGASMELYLPWKGYNASSSPRYRLTPQAFELAKTTHPAWDTLSEAVQKIFASCCYQTLGESLDLPSALSLCWTQDGCESESTRTRATRGTATSIVLAERFGVPLFNLRNDASREALNRFLTQQGISYRVPVSAPAPAQASLF